MTKTKELEKRVKRGVKWLNEVKPGWHKKIDLKTLNLKDAGVCVCGQLFEDFWQTIYKDDPDSSFGLATKRKKIAMSHRTATKRGFVVKGEGVYVNDILTRIWFLEITKLNEE